jgi:hypothetical protein
MGVFVTREHVRHNKSGITHRDRAKINHLSFCAGRYWEMSKRCSDSDGMCGNRLVVAGAVHGLSRCNRAAVCMRINLTPFPYTPFLTSPAPHTLPP